jgi:lysozyme
VAGVYGIDVSHWQGTIQWDQVAKDGKKFALIKASEGTGFLDDKFRWNRAKAKTEGIAVGAYHYFRPGYDPQAQARHFYDTVGPLVPGDLIPWVDVEDDRPYVNGPIISTNVIVKQLAEMLVECDRLWGYMPGVYTGIWFWNRLPVGWPMDRPLWTADWNGQPERLRPGLPNGWTDYHIHQYSARGTVDGIRGPVDLNWMPSEEKFTELTISPTLDPGQDAILAALDKIQEGVDELRRLLV